MSGGLLLLCTCCWTSTPGQGTPRDGRGLPTLAREEARMIREFEEGRLGELPDSRSDAGGIVQQYSQTCTPAWASTHTRLSVLCPPTAGRNDAQGSRALHLARA